MHPARGVSVACRPLEPGAPVGIVAKIAAMAEVLENVAMAAILHRHGRGFGTEFNLAFTN